MTEFRIVDALPEKPSPAVRRHNENATKPIMRFCIEHPNQWVEILRKPMRTGRGSNEATPFVRANGLREYGLEAEVRRDGAEYVLFARLVPGKSA